MPRIIVTTDSPSDMLGAVLYEERVCAPVLESAHASAQLLERLTWAVADAEEAERDRTQSRSTASAM
jgi:hypothetical protein